MRIRLVILVALVLVGFPAASQDRQSHDEVVILRERLAKLQGVSVSLAGINVTEALRVLSDALIDIDARLSRIEKASPAR